MTKGKIVRQIFHYTINIELCIFPLRHTTIIGQVHQSTFQVSVPAFSFISVARVFSFVSTLVTEPSGDAFIYEGTAGVVE